jgi:hypothetical protein
MVDTDHSQEIPSSTITRTILRVWISLTVLFLLIGLYPIISEHTEYFTDFTSRTGILSITIAVVGLLFATGVWLLPKKIWTQSAHKRKGIRQIIHNLKWLNLIILLAFGAIYLGIYWFLGNYSWLIEPLSIKIAWFLIISTLQGIILAGWRGWKLGSSLWIAAMMLGLIHTCAKYLPNFTDYPFAISWAETSWYYYASFFFSHRIYSASIPWPFLDIGRPFLLSFPLIIPHISIGVERIWQVFLWIGITIFSAFALVHRFPNIRRSTAFLWTVIWVFLFFQAGSIYYHLQLIAVIILMGVNPRRPLASVPWLILASILGGIVRINWLPVPTMLALAIYFLEIKLEPNENWLKYLKWPIWWGIIGLFSGGVSLLVYLWVSGQVETRINTKFSSPLIWERLLPNSAFLPGILIGCVLLGLPLVWIIVKKIKVNHLGGLRTSLLSVMLLILFIGGIISSLKIGGGTNLHNLDAFWILLALWAGYSLNEQSGTINKFLPMSNTGLYFLSLIPVLWCVLTNLSLPGYNRQTTQNDLRTLRQVTQASAAQGGEVLFIYQRHLLTFGEIGNVPLVTDYELEELTEMGMGNNEVYLHAFQNDLYENRFALIITDIQPEMRVSRDNPLVEESDTWWFTVTVPLREYYHEVLRLPDEGIQVWAPNP